MLLPRTLKTYKGRGNVIASEALYRQPRRVRRPRFKRGSVYAQTDVLLDRSHTVATLTQPYVSTSGKKPSGKYPAWVVRRSQDLFLETMAELAANLTYIITVLVYRHFPNRYVFPFHTGLLDDASYLQGILYSSISSLTYGSVFAVLAWMIHRKHGVNAIRASMDLLTRRYLDSLLVLIVIVLKLVDSFIVSHTAAYWYAMGLL